MGLGITWILDGLEVTIVGTLGPTLTSKDGLNLTDTQAGLAATTYMRSFVDFDYVNMAMIPLFLFSATFFPLARYPTGLQTVIRLTPLYQGVVLERSLVIGDLHWTLLLHAAYLLAMGLIGLRVASRRIGLLLQP